MLELIDILSLHAEKYPLMLCEDAVKLVYQNEFAGGHMIKDASSALAMLRRATAPCALTFAQWIRQGYRWKR